jgi:hypothetical protein
VIRGDAELAALFIQFFEHDHEPIARRIAFKPVVDVDALAQAKEFTTSDLET